MTKIWKMGISPDNFISDTQDLTNEELGVYFRLLCYAWKKEAYLPKDHERLKRIGQGCNDKSINYLLETFFIEDEKGYYCKAQKEEFDWVVEKSGKATESANRRWDKTQSKRISERNANYSHSHSYKEIDNVFENIWSKLTVKRGTKSNALKVYRKIHDKVKDDLLVDKYNSKCTSVTDKQFIPHFSTWLNSEGWTEVLVSDQKDTIETTQKDPMRNLSLWKKGIKTMNDYEEDIIKAHKQGQLTDEHMEKLNITI
jgi:uncharacterized protein YdaU (DUF1376 family)